MTKTYATNHGARLFRLPRTPRCKVIYRRDGSDTNYSAPPFPTPATNDALQLALLKIGIALRQVVRVEAVFA